MGKKIVRVGVNKKFDRNRGEEEEEEEEEKKNK